MGCYLSKIVFNNLVICAEGTEISIDGLKLSHFFFAVDIADKLRELLLVLEELHKVCLKTSLEINSDKTKIMANLVPSESFTFGNMNIDFVH